MLWIEFNLCWTWNIPLNGIHCWSQTDCNSIFVGRRGTHMHNGDHCWKRQHFEAWPSLSSSSTLWLDSSGRLWPALPGHLLPHVSRADRCWRQQRPDSFQQLLRSSTHTHALSDTPPPTDRCSHTTQLALWSQSCFDFKYLPRRDCPVWARLVVLHGWV